MDEATRRLRMSNPWHLLATGFGSGLSPVVPGTMGSLAAIPFWLLLIQLPWQLYSLLVMFSICIGVYLCHQTAKDMKVHDHGSIVWDEFVGMWITLMALPVNDWQWVAGGFVIFRILDMWKPWPIRCFDRNVHGGMGIMIDDIVAGVRIAARIDVPFQTTDKGSILSHGCRYSCRCTFIVFGLARVQQQETASRALVPRDLREDLGQCGALQHIIDSLTRRSNH